MLKKIAYIVLTSGLFLAPLGVSAHVSPFPTCYGSDCGYKNHTHASTDRMNIAGDSMKNADDRKMEVNNVKERGFISNNPFPPPTND